MFSRVSSTPCGRRHAPVIFPAVLGRPIPFSAASYGPLALLHGSLALRALGDLAAFPGARAWGGLLNAAAILFFFVATAAAIRRAR